MPLRLEIVTPERLTYNDDVDMVIVPGRNGQLGILPHHTPLISSLGVGELRIKKGSTEELRVMRSGQPDEAGVKRLHAALERAVAEIEGAASDGELLPA